MSNEADELVAKFTNKKRSALAADNEHSQADSLENNAVFSFTLGRTPNLYLDFEFLSGELISIPYRDFRKVRFLSDNLLAFYTATEIFEIEGKNLRELHRFFKKHHLVALKEGGKKNPPVTDKGVCIFSITETDLRFPTE